MELHTHQQRAHTVPVLFPSSVPSPTPPPPLVVVEPEIKEPTDIQKVILYKCLSRFKDPKAAELIRTATADDEDADVYAVKMAIESVNLRLADLTKTLTECDYFRCSRGEDEKSPAFRRHKYLRLILASDYITTSISGVLPAYVCSVTLRRQDLQTVLLAPSGTTMTLCKPLIQLAHCIHYWKTIPGRIELFAVELMKRNTEETIGDTYYEMASSEFPGNPFRTLESTIDHVEALIRHAIKSS